MSLRILNPVMVTRNISCKRDLFGAANSNNSEETTRLFQEELERSQQLANMKWGFDFRSGVPLAGNTQFVWERVSCREFNFAPQQYTLTRAAHVRQTLPVEEDTEMELMLDERSERENIRMAQSTLNTTDSDSCDDSQDEEATSVFKLPQVVGGSSTTSHCAHTNAASSRNRRNSAIEKLTVTLRKRQPKITEYMKERKRLIQTPKKKTPTKRMRTSSGSSSTSASSTTSASSSSSSCRARLGL